MRGVLRRTHSLGAAFISFSLPISDSDLMLVAVSQG